MDVVLLSRLQFAVTIFFHFIFVPLTLGLAIIIAWMESRYLASGDEFWKKQTQFWGRLFLINFTLGVVTGITQEFQFGTNWSRYSEYVGDIFGSILAIEATVAFFLESTFIAVWAFGWNRVGKKLHCLCIWLVAIGGNISAFWIIVANGFMQHPVGYAIDAAQGRAVLTDFSAVVLNGFAWGQFAHTILASWALAGFFVLGISAWHLLHKRDSAFFQRSFRMVAPYTLILCILLALSGDEQGKAVARWQPEKLAAMEAQWQTENNAPFYLFVWPKPASEENVEFGRIPGLLSWLSYGDSEAQVKGLLDYAPTNRPPISEVFWSFRGMAALGALFILLALAATWQRKRAEPCPRLLKALIWNIPLPYLSIMLGWVVAEMGRQPWIVYKLMRTAEAVSPIPESSVALSLIGFTVVYTILGILDIYLLRKYALKSPEAGEL